VDFQSVFLLILNRLHLAFTHHLISEQLNSSFIVFQQHVSTWGDLQMERFVSRTENNTVCTGKCRKCAAQHDTWHCLKTGNNNEQL